MLCSSSKRDDVILAFIERPLTKDARPARARAERAWRGRRQGGRRQGRAQIAPQSGGRARLCWRDACGRARARARRGPQRSVRAGRARRGPQRGGRRPQTAGGGQTADGRVRLCWREACGRRAPAPARGRGPQRGGRRPQTRGGRRQQTVGRGRRPQDRRPLGGADRRRAGAGADRRPQTRAQTADGAGADRRRTPALGHYVLERSGRTCGRGAHPATVPVASSATGGVSPVDEAERRF